MSKKTIESAPVALAAIDTDALETASGGRRAAGASSSRSNDNAAILDALQDIEVAMREMSAKSTNNNSSDSNNMMMMTLMTSLMGNNNSGGNCGRKRGC
jgi:hypothetical protein